VDIERHSGARFYRPASSQPLVIERRAAGDEQIHLDVESINFRVGRGGQLATQREHCEP